MRPYIHPDFLLQTAAARTLYHEYAEGLPIVDYHCHLPPAELAENHKFRDLTEIWLEGDHYKWRAMRAIGLDEKYCTGNASPYEKFLAFAETVPQTLRNPIHHWTHLELSRYFGIEELLTPESAPRIWSQANEKLAGEELRAWGILKQFNVQLVGTTDDPSDDLAHHIALQQSACPAMIVPTFRPDKALFIEKTADWNKWVDRLAAVSARDCSTFSGFLGALAARIAFFKECGARASDHGLERCPARIGSEAEAAATFAAARAGRLPNPDAAEAFAGFVLTWLGERYAEEGWAMQLHLGAIRSVNGDILRRLGPDKGCDSIGDFTQVVPLARLLGELAARQRLPRTIVYNLNPADNHAFATMVGNFFEAGVPGKMQFGSGWWFLDQLDGMTAQLNTLSSVGLLSQFIGMLTDSRSFMSYCRHEYFRRLLCNLLGNDMERGLLPDDTEQVGALVSAVCCGNAQRYFGLEARR